MEKDSNHASPFVRLKVADAGGRRFSILVPRGRSNEGGGEKWQPCYERGGFKQDGDLEKKCFDEGGGGVEKRDCTPRWKNDGLETLLC